MEYHDRNKNSKDLRVIKTARDKDTINKAARRGYRPLVKKVVPSENIRSKYSVVQNQKTGEIEIFADFRESLYANSRDNFETVIGWTYYYPYNFKSPYAAYLIPADIKVGERVFVEDLIEDYVGSSWNQGDAYRLENCEAIWNGTDLEIQYDPRTSCSRFIG